MRRGGGAGLRYHGCADWGKNCHVCALWCISGVCSCGQIRVWFARVPDNLSNEAASICEMFDGAFRGTIAPAEIQPGERVLIVGAGPMGLTAASAAAACGAKVCVMDFYENRLRKALEMGACFAYDRSRMSAKEIAEAVRHDMGEIDLACMCIALDRSEELDAFMCLSRRFGKTEG